MIKYRCFGSKSQKCFCVRSRRKNKI